jgi:hypothetical protein
MMKGAIAPSEAEPSHYSHLLVVCGPCYAGLLRKSGFDIGRYSHCHKIGINLTMVDPLGEWNPFDLLLERDSDQAVRPDLAFLARVERVPVAGRCVIRKQREYGDRQRHDLALMLIDDIIVRHKLPSIEIDTHWPRAGNLIIQNSATALTSLINRVDVLITNRLHGLVFALHSGVPALAIDAIAGGDKVSAQARVLNWPACTLAEEASQERMDAALMWCLSPEARSAAAAVRDAAISRVGRFEDDVAEVLGLSAEYREDGRSSGWRGLRWRDLLRGRRRNSHHTS